MGDLYELNVLYPPYPNTTATTTPPTGALGRRYTPGHGIRGPGGILEDPLECSALIKLTPAALERMKHSPTSPTPQPDAEAEAGTEAGAVPYSLGAGSEVGPKVASARRRLARGRRQLRGQEEVGGEVGEEVGGSMGRVRSDDLFWAGHNTWRPYYAMIRCVVCVGHHHYYTAVCGCGCVM